MGADLQELLQDVAGNSSVHLSEMESDLLHINLLLIEAVRKLSGDVLQIGRDVQDQQQFVRQLTETASCSPFALEKLDSLNQAMNDSIASVITAMQFQDMTSQLLDRVFSRVAALQGMVEEMEKLATGISRAKSEGDVQAMVRAMSEEMNSKRHELEGQHAERVSQKHMESGSIEFF